MVKARLGPSEDLPQADFDMIRSYMDWLPLNPETNSVASLYINKVG